MCISLMSISLKSNTLLTCNPLVSISVKCNSVFTCLHLNYVIIVQCLWHWCAATIVSMRLYVQETIKYLSYLILSNCVPFVGLDCFYILHKDKYLIGKFTMNVWSDMCPTKQTHTPSLSNINPYGCRLSSCMSGQNYLQLLWCKHNSGQRRVKN